MSKPTELSKRMPSFKVENSIRMRGEPTKAEVALIELCRDLCGRYVDRIGVQVPMLGYIADVYFHQAKLIVEADGGYHDTDAQRMRDAERDSAFEREGIATVRLKNSDVLFNPSKARRLIEAQLMKRVRLRPIKTELTIHQKYAARVAEIAAIRKRRGLD